MKHSWLVLLCSLSGCYFDAGEDETVSITTEALNDSLGVEGTACYQDGPDRKGKMEYGMCCFDDPKAGTSECIVCDKEHRCTVGGATPGALTSNVRPPVWSGGGVLDPNPPVTPRVFKSAAALSSAELRGP